MSRKRLEEAVRQFLEALGERARGAEFEKTPARVAEAWSEEILSGYGQDPASLLEWDRVEGVQPLVVVRDITFQSICLHHLLPFTGQVSIAYLPGERLAGLSKFVRLVDCLSRRMQIQERLTLQVVEAIAEALEPRGAACLVAAEHLCMVCRGVRRPGALVVTSRALGACDEPPLREEVMRLLDPSRGSSSAPPAPA